MRGKRQPAKNYFNKRLARRKQRSPCGRTQTVELAAVVVSVKVFKPTRFEVR